MKIAVLTGSVSRNAGGLFTSVRKLTMGINTVNQNEITVFALEDIYTDEDIGKWTHVGIKVFSNYSILGYALSPKLKEAVLNADIDLLHLHGIWKYTAYISSVWYKHKSRPLIISPRGMLDAWALKNSAWKKKVAGWLYENHNLQSAACIHALCESEYQSIRSYGLKNPVCIIPNGVDIPDLQSRQQLPPWNSQIVEGKNVMLFLSRIHRKKGLENLIEAWSKVKPADWVLVIAGWEQNGHENQLKKLVKQSEIERDIIFLGPVFNEKKQACFQNAKAFILPSFSEGLPMSVLEAWSYKLPVIMTSQCNIPEGFASGAAINIEPTIDSVTEGLSRFIALSAEKQKQMGRNGFKLIKEKFSWSKIAAQTIEVYKWILGQAEKPDCIKLN